MAALRPVLTTAEMLAAEQSAIDAGTSVETLMERAGAALAEAAYRFAGARDALILAGPGNNGGDGYVAARYLSKRRGKVRIAALAEPSSPAARWARSQWDGAVEPFNQAVEPAPILIDALFGTGLRRGLDTAVIEQLSLLRGAAHTAVACDLPSGIASDSGAELSAVPNFDLTVTFGALKPAHRLFPAMHKCGRVVLADIGLSAEARWSEIGTPELPRLDSGGHKYDRGMVHCVAGAMPGAMALAASAAARAGAGYVRIQAERPVPGVPAAVVQGQQGGMGDARIGAVLIGPGLGKDGETLLDEALSCGRPLVIDGDALRAIADPTRLKGVDAVLTPHGGEFASLFPDVRGTKPEMALRAAETSGAVVVFKGPDTLVAAPDGRLGFAPPAPSWLASAGTGDVLAGLVAAMRARGLAGFEAACAAVWIHGRAAEVAGRQMIADDLVRALPHVLAPLNG